MEQFFKNVDGVNAIFHIALNDDGKLQPIVCAQLPWGNVELLRGLLNTTRPGASIKDNGHGTGYLFVYDNNLRKPYPSVMIWKYRSEADGRVICDMGKEDMTIIPYAVETYLADQNK